MARSALFAFALCSCLLVRHAESMSTSSPSGRSPRVQTGRERARRVELEVHVPMPHLSPGDISQFVDRAHAIVSERIDKLEPSMARKGVYQAPGTPAWFMASAQKAKPASWNLTKMALIAEETTKHMVQKYRLSREQVSFGLPVMDVRNSDLGPEHCPLTVDYPCQPRKYRAFSGYCNNVQNPRWGNAFTRYLRLLPPDYSDGVSAPRQNSKSQPLPSAREVSLAVHRDEDLPHPHLMAMAAVWGEFILHDVSHTPQMSGFEGQPLKCCGVSYGDFHPECFPIRLPETDPVHAPALEKCEDYVRSAAAPRVGCTLGPREQLNQATSFLDGSGIYGSSRDDASELRTFHGGLLRTTSYSSIYNFAKKPLLPIVSDTNACPTYQNSTGRCFKAGDMRANEHSGLLVLHTLFMREHNRVARELAEINPHWEDETLFQEARRIVGAEIQHITYSEYLPLILGKMTMEKLDLEPQSSGHYNGYDINANPGVSNSVAVAALRFVASLMPKSLDLFDKNGHKMGEERMAPGVPSALPATWSRLSVDGRGANGPDSVLRGLLNSPAQHDDEFINDVMTNHMFEDPSKGHGMDLAAQVIQQGRDHGIPSYVKWREYCDLPLARRFQDLSDTIPVETISALNKVYRDVNDIDLFTGALAEIPSEGAMVGPTLSCLLGRHFVSLRKGDRYWYENDLPPSSFTREQLAEIRKTTLARLICDNSDEITEVQPKAFLHIDPFLNYPTSCKKGGALPAMELNPAWTSQQFSLAGLPIQAAIHQPDRLLTESVQRAKRDLGDVIHREMALLKQKRSADPQSPIGTAYGFNRPTRQAAEIANTSLILQFASQRFVSSFLQGHLQDHEEGPKSRGDQTEKSLRALLAAALPGIDISDAVEIPKVFQCDEQTAPCDHTSKYRSVTGWCNNLRKPEVGKSLRAFVRLLPSAYEDGLSTPRALSVTGRQLPSARLVSVGIHADVSQPHVRYSLMFMQFGQLLDHDLTHTPVHKGFGDTILDCKACDSVATVHPECFPIPVPDGDPYFPRVNLTNGQPTCIPVIRSLPGQLTLGVREQLNQVTAYVDASFVYGSDVCEARALREFSGGRMNVTRNTARGLKPLLPTTATHPECKSDSGLCFRAGDARSSEQPGLASLHTLFLREHNRLVSELHRLNPHWGDEELHREGRRILSSVTQHITYNEFLPRALGMAGAAKYGLDLLRDGYFTGYDPDCDPTIANEFAAAAFRFGHSLLKPQLERADVKYVKREPAVRLRDTFFNPDILYNAGVVDDLIRGLAATPMETLDQFITSEVTNHLFENRKMPYSGMDLAAINIQRARDHGIPGYNEYRAYCNMTRARSFDDLRQEIPSKLVERLRQLYDHVDDIDLFPGGLAETALKGGVVGPTFACIIGRQFNMLRKCDRFWYENADPLVRFTEAQLSEIRKASLARIVCDNCDRVETIQRSLLDLVDPFLNPRIPCQALPSIDLTPWKQRRSCVIGSQTIEAGAAVRTSPCVMCTCTSEGPICQSLRINNCFHLARSFSAESILADDVCKVQCAYVFRALPSLRESESKDFGVPPLNRLG
ncbi:uncharacterized protein LOC124155895 isoform X2 [Ischnura elegans]|uniref:uncharacterized protein LOC124155895 isoform X2 n=1 Tax=Ischnura elegans TaxID=197161 RepID=UPI001ED898B3|nr:uncharacterized protein LOC124155895 isoform X2 [Ischnura elegans]